MLIEPGVTNETSDGDLTWPAPLNDSTTELSGLGLSARLGFHVNDWLVPNTNVLVGRGMMGDGVVDNRELREWVDAEGYDGPIEVEIFNEEIWSRDGDDVLAQMKERYVSHVL